MKPVRDIILIEKQEVTQTEGGIFIPLNADPYNTPHPVAEALEVGSDVTLVKKGDKFIYSRNVETPVDYNGKTHYLILESHILAIV